MEVLAYPSLLLLFWVFKAFASLLKSCKAEKLLLKLSKELKLVLNKKSNNNENLLKQSAQLQHLLVVLPYKNY